MYSVRPFARQGVTLDGDVINTKIDLTSGAVLTVLQSPSGTGLTLNGNNGIARTDLTNVGNSSAINLDFTAPLTAADWDLRWKDTSHSKNWISTLTKMINNDQINLTLQQGRDLFGGGFGRLYPHRGGRRRSRTLVAGAMGLALAGRGAAQGARQRLVGFLTRIACSGPKAVNR